MKSGMKQSQIPLEKSIVNKILKWLNSLPNAKFKKSHGSMYNADDLDIIGCIAGRMIVLEVKRPEIGRLTEKQKNALFEWKSAGAISEVVTSLEEVKEIFVKEGMIQ